MTESNREEYASFYEELDEDYVDPWRVKVNDFLCLLNRNKFKTVAAVTAGTATLGLLVGLGRLNSSEDSLSPGGGPGVAQPGTSESVDPNKTPTHSSGGFSIGNVSLECTGITIEQIPGTTEYDLTPKVTVFDGDIGSPHLYTVAGLYNNTNAVVTGIKTVRVNGPDVATIVVVDTYGSTLGEEPNNPDALVDPLGGGFSDSLIYPCDTGPDFPANLNQSQ